MRLIKNTFLAVTALGFAAQPLVAVAAEKEPIVLQPASPWQLDMAEDKCRLARMFGPEGERTAFYLEQWNPSDRIDFGIAGPAVKRFRAERDTSFAFTPGGNAAEFQFDGASLADYGTLITGWTTVVHDDSPDAADADQTEPDIVDYTADPYGLPALKVDGAGAITRFELKQRGRRDVVLELGPMENAVLALNMCMANLVEHWGFDLDQQKAIVSPPQIANLEAVVKRIVSSYPSEAERIGAQADFHLRLTVDAGGEVAACKLVNQTLADDFDMRRHPCVAFEELAIFEPARLADGTAAPSYVTHRIRYRMRR